MKDPSKWLEETLRASDAQKDPRGEPDCYVVMRTHRGEDFKAPIAIFKSHAALRKRFPGIVEDYGERWGVSLHAWWFDD